MALLGSHLKRSQFSQPYSRNKRADIRAEEIEIECCFINRAQKKIGCILHVYFRMVSHHFPRIRVLHRSQRPRGLRRCYMAARLLRSCVRIPPAAWMSVCCECCVLSGRDLCNELITRPEESYRLLCVAVCDIETTSMRSQTSINCN
jgi:hypothetical protein